MIVLSVSLIVNVALLITVLVLRSEILLGESAYQELKALNKQQEETLQKQMGVMDAQATRIALETDLTACTEKRFCDAYNALNDIRRLCDQGQGVPREGE